MITKRQILRCQNLLHKDYQSTQVVIYRNRLLFIIKMLLSGMPPSYIMEYILKKSRGWYNPEDKKVHIPIFSFNESKYLSLEIIYTLYHELRHHYQFTHKAKLLNQRNWNLTLADSGYNADPTERDTNKFAARMCTKYRQEISEILGIKNDWEIVGYS